MTFKAENIVTKISVSDINKSRVFYEKTLGFVLDPRYSIVENHEETAYLELFLDTSGGVQIIFGLFNDIKSPFIPAPDNGTVPSFLVEDIEATLQDFLNQGVVIDSQQGNYIISNTSDQGYVDKFFFFRDPDNNSLVIRQNMN